MKKQFIQKLGFSPKENSNNIFIKKYKNNYILEVDFEKEFFNYGNKIKIESKTTSNFSQAENWVVFECVNRLLEKGYNPEDIILEKTYKLGHQNKGRLDILVKKEGKTFLMIECKTWGKEFEKEVKNMLKDGGQLFSYFQQDREAKYLVLYASNEDLEYKNEIVTIEEHYKETTSVVDFYDRWNKLTKQNGVFEDWVDSYKFEGRALTKKDLKPIKQEDASIIFNSFLEILRKNTVSDKPNAFNKIFTLFLCKIYDEGDKRENEELEFQWIEGKDNHFDFQLRLNELYKKGMDVLLEKKVSILNSEEFNLKFAEIDENIRIRILNEFNKLRLEQNNEFAIKDVFDNETFLENSIVLKEVVELLQKYKIRYEEKQPFLGDFFELLLTTGLKQETGQFFTPVPITRFICKSIPIKNIIEEKLEDGDFKNLLPSVIDYAAGSGHFLTESMEEIQTILRKIEKNNLKPDVAKKIKAWEGNFDWAYDYMYGIEKDYRLVKTAKVGCFLHGDGIANIIHGDGLDSFEKSKKYKGLLKKFTQDDKKENAQFDLVLSNPPYSIKSNKGSLFDYGKNDFDLFSVLTEKSSEIEALFIERTSQLLKEGGIAGIILPSSILSNTGIYTKAREIILKDFEIIAITELGSNTFMATGTNTVTLFLRKRNKYFSNNLKSSVDKFFTNFLDVVFKGTQIEKPVSKYISQVWENIKFEDYKTLLEKRPNEKVLKNEIFIDYKKNFNEKDLYEKIIDLEKEKLFYFILTYSQKLVLVKSGEKKKEKEFLGYEFSARKGSEGIHPLQKGKLIDDCTKLFDPNSSDNPEKVNSYIHKAFLGQEIGQVSEELKDHIFQINLRDTLIFDRSTFDKTISLNLKKKVKIESKWEIEKLGDVCDIEYGTRIIKKDSQGDTYPVYGGGGETFRTNNFNRENCYIISRFGMSHNCVRFVNGKIFLNDSGLTLKSTNKNLSKKYLDLYLYINQEYIYDCGRGTAQKNIDIKQFNSLKIPLPPKDIQQKIVDEIGELEKIEEKNNERIGELKNNISSIISNDSKLEKLENIAMLIKRGKGAKYGNSNIQIIKSGQARGYREFDFSLRHYVVDGFILDERKLEKGDILINSTGVGTAGRVTQFNLDGIFVVDTHITILRLIKNKAISDYVLNALVNIGFKTIEKMAQGQSGQIELSLGIIKNLKIPLPPLEKQKEIVEKIEVLEKEIEKLKSENNNIPDKKKEILDKYL